VKKKKELDEMGVPIRYMQLDDWWYQGNIMFYYSNLISLLGHRVSVWCIDSWEAREDLFPDGLFKFHEQIDGIPIIGYVPFFCPKNEYQKFKFTISNSYRVSYTYPSSLTYC